MQEGGAGGLDRGSGEAFELTVAKCMLKHATVSVVRLRRKGGGEEGQGREVVILNLGSMLIAVQRAFPCLSPNSAKNPRPYL